MKTIRYNLAITLAISVTVSCGFKANEDEVYLPDSFATEVASTNPSNSDQRDEYKLKKMSGVEPSEIIAYAKTLIGVPYKYGSSDEKIGLDCSGFITAVYRNFGIGVPRSSVEFTNYGKTVPIVNCKLGDLILFTGTDVNDRTVGHMGIVVQTQDTIKFIHSTSGSAYGVTITPLNSSYQKRFEKIVRIDN